MFNIFNDLSGVSIVNYILHGAGFGFFFVFTCLSNEMNNEKEYKYDIADRQALKSISVKCLLYPLTFSGLWRTYSIWVAIVGIIIIGIFDYNTYDYNMYYNQENSENKND